MDFTSVVKGLRSHVAKGKDTRKGGTEPVVGSIRHRSQ